MSCSGPAPQGSREARGSSGSRDSSPDNMALERSMESLEMVHSGSSEDCLLESSPVESAEHLEDGSEKAVSILEGRGPVVDGSKASGEPMEPEEDGQDGDKKEVKRKKRRISSRRERKISLSSSDKVVREIAGVQVTN